MGAIENYTNTKLEMMSDQSRLKSLLLKKEELFQRYCGVKAVAFNDDPKVTTHPNHDLKLCYIEKCDEVNPATNMSLNQEIEKLQNDIQKREIILEQIECALRQLHGIEYELYRDIVINGYKPSDAVRNEAVKYSYSEKQIWKKYYHMIAPSIRKLRKVVSKR